jgi:tetratricopeptide (TPR) repeat protein
MKIRAIKKFFPLLFLAVIFLCGNSYLGIDEIETAILKQDYSQAQKLAEKFSLSTSSNRVSFQARYYLGLTYLRSGEYDQARGIFKALIQDKPSAPWRDKAYLSLIDSYYLDEEYKQALKIGRKLLKVSPHSEFLSLIYLRLAKSNLKLSHWNDARVYLEKVAHNYSESMEVNAAKQLLEEKQYFTVQVGAFMDRKRAEQLVLQLNQKSEYAYIVETLDEEKRKFFRVRVGKLSLLNEARKLKSKLTRQGYPAKIYP